MKDNLLKSTIIVLIMCVIGFIPKVNAQVTSLYLFDSSFNTLQSQQAQCFSTSYPNLKSNVKYIRWNFNDAITTGKKYTAYFTVELTRQSDYAWFGWSNNSGININGSYLSPNNPTASQTISQSSFPVASNVNLYKKESSFQYIFTANSSASTWFFQLDPDLGNYQYICLKAYQLQETADSTAELNSAINNQTTTIINNNNSNTQSIIDNQNQNTQDIIDNQNANSQQQIESQKVCKIIDREYGYHEHSYLSSGGYLGTTQGNFSVSDYINIYNSELEFLNLMNISAGTAYCYYNDNKVLTNCYASNTSNQPSSNDKYIRLTFDTYNNLPILQICKNGNQALSDDINDLNNNITDSNVNGANSIGQQVLEDSLEESNLGFGDLLLSIIDFIESLFDSTCSPLEFTLPFVHNEVSLPCMSTIYTTHFPTLFTLYQVITTGLIAYRVILNLFHKVHQLEDPNYDKVEVLEL